jgi:hypothetical protein
MLPASDLLSKCPPSAGTKATIQKAWSLKRRLLASSTERKLFRSEHIDIHFGVARHWNPKAVCRLLRHRFQTGEETMKRVLFAAAMIGAVATPAIAEEVGVRVGPVGAGVTVGESREYRDRDRERTTVIKEREPANRTTIIKKEDEMGNRSKTVIHHND